ncbi:hypothetical protein A3K86_20630 [Photobacterium jeanii]|uniref:Periplasmic copper-binding protein NosD beta helix domain-containing protein n=1 Tax=Photobacterium jeanii TaxID=858640 RepID=A0A178K2L2_9GAMM|nr:chondroitinase-B domain-containing protein [Photobacterium jeanii]OAN11357.1 hypothetical protein A3K86_20630 [Photobacterium jeanii]PST90877.1 hypothetical protein C9I91_09735 [Photobacterium jeanii]
MQSRFQKLTYYFATVGILAHLGLGYVGYVAYSKITANAEPLPNTLQRVGNTIKKDYPSVAIAGDTLLEAGNQLSSKSYFWREFNPKSWPTVGPDYATAYAKLPLASNSIFVTNEDQLIKAINKAKPGDEIVVKNGSYYLEQKRINTSLHYPTSAKPIILRAETAGEVRLELTTLEGLLLSRPNWIVTGFKFIGNCQPHCEHAMHVVADADNLVISHNEFVDFNAAIKVNGVNQDFPDFGTIAYNYFYFTEPSKASSSVTPINLDMGNDWTIKNNIIRDFIKLGGNRVSYGAFIKAGSHNGIMENNLIACNTTNNDYGGYQIGLSLGGGGMKRANRRNKAAYETNHSVIRNNIIMHCNDVGVYVNKGKNSIVNNNILYNTRGIDVRFKESDAIVTNNVLSGDIRERDSGIATTSNNQVLEPNFLHGSDKLDGLFKAPAVGDFTPSKKLTAESSPYPIAENLAVSAYSTGLKDFCGNPILEQDQFLGAFKNALSCFNPE